MNVAHGFKFRRSATRIGLGLTLLASIAVAYAFKSIFARPGEAALQYIPADSYFAGSIDLNPSPAQALAFKHIDDAMDRNGMNRFLETSVLDIFGSGPGIEALKPLVQRNGAFAGVHDSTKDEMVGLALLSVTDGQEAQRVLAANGTPAYFRGTKYYNVKGVNGCMMVMDDFLVIGEKPIALHMARQVKEGTAPALAMTPEFTEARQHLASDANVMAFVNPKLLGQSGVEALKDAKASWLGAGLAIRDGGIGLSVWNQLDPSTIHGFAALSKTQAIRADLFQVMPSGAYGMFALSQPTNMFDQFEQGMSEEKDGQKGLDEMDKAAQDNLGMDLKTLKEAFQGDAVVAAYPSPGGDTAGVDLLAVVDDQNGATPGTALGKFQHFVESQTNKEGNSEPLWVSTDADGVTQYRLADKVQDDMRKGIGDGMDPQMVKKDVLIDKKTLTWASVGNVVLASTSPELLHRAISTYQTKATALSADAGFIKSDAEVLDGSQILAVFNLARIASGVRNTVTTTKMDKQGADAFDSITGAFEKMTDPFYLKTRLGSDGQVNVGAFIPIDYDKLFDFVGKQMKK
jgi:hypothetical protein